MKNKIIGIVLILAAIGLIGWSWKERDNRDPMVTAFLMGISAIGALVGIGMVFPKLQNN